MLFKNIRLEESPKGLGVDGEYKRSEHRAPGHSDDQRVGDKQESERLGRHGQ